MTRHTTKLEWGRERWFLLALAVAILAFFLEVLLLKSSFVSGDHRVQHYPWAFFFARQLNAFHLPWWSHGIGCGFPLLAEGQIGAFYLPNIVFLLLLPLRAAYNYEVLFHYFLASFSFYFLMRKMSLGRWSSFFSTLLFTFGTSQAGFYYNVTSQRVLSWFPLSLVLTQLSLERKHWIYPLGLGFVFSVQFFAGYQQYAIYSIGFVMFYFMWNGLVCRKGGYLSWMSVAGRAFGALMVLAVISAVQWIPMIELSTFSSRINAQEELAYIGSFNPLALSTLFFPHWDSWLRAEIYVGVFGLFFVLASLALPKSREEKSWLVLSLLVLLLALGRFSPLYVAMIKMTHFYGFRVPTKFLFFLGVSLAVLAGFGFEKVMGLVQKGKWKMVKKLGSQFSVLASMVIGGFFLTFFCLLRFKNFFVGQGNAFVERHFYAKPYHPHSLEVYHQKVESFYRELIRAMDLSNPYMFLFLLFIAGGVFILFMWVRWRLRPVLMCWLVTLFTFTNLYVYGFTSVKGNLEPFSFVQSSSQILSVLEQEDSLFRAHALVGEIASIDELPFRANDNLLKEIDSIGVYSPLALKRYKELLEDLGGVDDSLTADVTHFEKLEAQRSLIDFLNVRYLISDRPIELMGLTFVLGEGRWRLYRNENALPRYFFVTDYKVVSPERTLNLMKSAEFEPRRYAYLDDEVKHQTRKGRSGFFEPVTPVYYEEQNVVLYYNAETSGFLVSSELWYPGWKVWIDGVEASLLKGNGLFRIVYLEQGSHKIEFRYEPWYRRLIFH